MKIALISPYSEVSSYGIRTVSSYLKANGVSTRLFFLPLQKRYYSTKPFLSYPEKVVGQLVDLLKDVDLIGISLMSNYADSIIDLTRQLKRRLPAKPVFWGGIHATVLPKEAIKVADYICVGEGEIACLELCRHIANGADTTDIPGVWARNEDGITRNQPGPVVMDLDQFPAPDYDLEDNHVLVSNKRLIPLTRENLRQFHGATYWTAYTRGCPFSCAYCCNNALRFIDKDLTRLRAKSPENIINEIAAVRKNLPFIKYIYFIDDTLFALSEERIAIFARHYKEHIGLPFIVSGIQPSVFTEKKYDLLVDAGMIRVRMGIQSGSRRIIKDIYQRKQENTKVIEVSRSLQKYGRRLMMPNYDIILDNPWETREDQLETIDLLSRLAPPYSINVFSLQFFPGTSLYEKALQEEIITPDSKLRHMITRSPSYLNLVIVLFSLFKVPRWLLKILLSERFVQTNRQFNMLNRILYPLSFYRRGVSSIFTRDFSMFPPAMQMLFLKLFRI